ncbi:ABC transporter ATP-binding protein [Lachnospiraceae bacterium oral taxon 500]|nr:ABC transporter ATP-binding protein [Lachnospiraceae bacterium oral taxon 500]
MKIEMIQLGKKYGSFPALQNVNLTLGQGRIVGLLGPNGSGKTTLIKLLNGLIQPSTGQILLDGEKPGPKSKGRISYLPDKSYLNSQMTVEQLVDLFADFYTDFNVEKVNHLLKDLNIPVQKKLKTLSKGTQEKVQLALVMSREAEVYCLDEPIGGVDPVARDYILQTIISQYNRDALVIISTHLIYDVENVLDDVVMIKNGSIFLYDSVENIREREQKSVDEMFREVMRWY